MEPIVPETKVLAIASHVVYGHVGNTMAAFVMQAMGCDVAALNTVQFSNHTGYGQFKGTRATAGEITDLYAGLKQSYLTDFDVLLSGYAPSAEAVEAVGAIARDLKARSAAKPGSFFWVLDPVMGDEGRLYVNENVVPVYKSLLPHADLILPNQFEAELLSSTKITSHASLLTALTTVHTRYQVPHIIITSLRLPPKPSQQKPQPTQPSHSEPDTEEITIAASTTTSLSKPRPFLLTHPTHPLSFVGTGDLFAALTVVRFREAVLAAGLSGTERWVSPDDVTATELPLARAVEKVAASLQGVLGVTVRAREVELERLERERGGEGKGDGEESLGERGMLREMKAKEVRVSRCLGELWHEGGEWKVSALETETDVGKWGKGDGGE